MSAAEGEAGGREPARPRATQAYGTIVVVGGGCYGSYYLRQLTRAVAAGALTCDRVVVVDRDPGCQVAVGLGAPPREYDRAVAGSEHHHSAAPRITVSLEVAEWTDYFAHYLAAAAGDPQASARDAVVPSPLMPHLTYEWLLARARSRWPDRTVQTVPLAQPPSTPWERAAPDGTHYVSFAEWMCPINCIEPALCPAIRGPRTWSMPPAMRAYVAAERTRGREILGPVLFHCTHRAYGVGMIDTSAVLDADAFVATVGARGEARVLVGTVSHCHGALNLMRIE